MKKITDIDQNFQIKTVWREDMKLYNIRSKPFQIYGLFQPQEPGKFKRLPGEVAQNMSDGAFYLHTNTSGGRIRFQTDSRYIALKACFPSVCVMPHMAATGSCGFDLYADGVFQSAFTPPITYVDQFQPTFDLKGGYESILEFEDNRMRDIVIHFPLYNDVTDVFIGLQETAQVLQGKEYRHKTPVVFYGSSITQGACASRPGNAYQAILSRRLNFDFINLGFSGNARGEDAIAEYIAGLSMSAFVYDYDHNAPTVSHLKKTHHKMYQTIREKNPNLPIILATRPNRNGTNQEIQQRIEVVRQTYETARNQGDRNIYFVSGQDMLNSFDPGMFTVDGCHPNDFGFFCMAEAFEAILRPLFCQ